MTIEEQAELELLLLDQGEEPDLMADEEDDWLTEGELDVHDNGDEIAAECQVPLGI